MAKGSGGKGGGAASGGGKGGGGSGGAKGGGNPFSHVGGNWGTKNGTSNPSGPGRGNNLDGGTTG